MRVLIVLAFAALAAAQTPAPEVRGVVVERGSNAPLAGATVSLFAFGPNANNVVSQFLVTKTSTDANGAFSFKPVPLGILTLAASKPGYKRADEFRVQVTAATPSQTVRMSMLRPGSLTGRVVDPDGNPMAKLRLFVQPGAQRFGRDEVVTDASGSFTAYDLEPGPYLIHLMPQWPEREELLPYSKEEFEIVDQEVEEAYWPGGVSNPDQALPVAVSGGGSANLGTITVRRIPYYRAHVSLQGECAPSERWVFRVQTVPRSPVSDPEDYAACQKEFLLTGLTPGPHELVLWVGRDVKTWAVVPFTVGKANTEMTLSLSPPSELRGQVTAASGKKLEDLGGVNVMVRSTDGIPVVDPLAQSDTTGQFTLHKVAGRKQWISVEPERAGTYIKEIRYGGQPLKTYTFDHVPGARMEIVLDSGAATLTGKFPGEASGHGSVLLVRDGVDSMLPSQFPPFQFISTDEAGSYNFRGVPPGTYKVLSVGHDAEFDLDAWTERLARAQTVTLRPNEVKSVDLK